MGTYDKSTRLIFAITLIVSCLFAASCVTPSTPKPAEQAPKPPVPRTEIVFAGSGVNIPIIVNLVKDFQKESQTKILVPDSIGSAGAIKAILEGDIDLGLTSRPLSPAELTAGIKQIPYAKTSIIIAVHPSVPEVDISAADILAIYKGEKRQWSDGSIIVPMLMYKGDAVNTAVIRYIPELEVVLNQSFVENRWKQHFNDLAMAKAIASIPGSIGFSDSSYLEVPTLQMKALRLDGVAPSQKNLETGLYKMSRVMSFVYKGALDPRVKSFLDFIFSSKGKTIILSNDGIPIGENLNEKR